ncbi:MAG: FG-GAP-like repeat-containing protein [Nannocystaceae bacterium]
MSKYADPAIDGGWFLGGDMHFVDSAHLYDYRQAARDGSRLDSAGNIEFRSTVWCDGDGFDWIWDISHKLRITYCIGPFDNETLKQAILPRLYRSIAEIERTTDVNYIEIQHPSPEDCESSWKAGSVFYIVRQARECTQGTPLNIDCDCGATGQFACTYRGFATAPRNGNTQFGKIAFRPELLDTPNNAGTARTVLHELGHTLGLEHEHRRWVQSGNDSCKPMAGDTAWRAVTPADSDSIMGYPYCDQINDLDIAALSAGDRLGLHYLYSLPKSGAIHFDADSSDDILWITPGAEDLEVWYGGHDAADNILFQKEIFAAAVSPERISRRIKPIPLRLDPTSDLTYVFLHAPGEANADPGGDPMVMWEQRDFILKPLSGQPDPFVRVPFQLDPEMSEIEMPERFAVPIVGNFRGPNIDEVWWLLPGADGVRHDVVWRFDLMSNLVHSGLEYDATFSADNYYRPLVSTWAANFPNASGVPDSQVLWWREQPTPGRFRLLAENLSMNGPSGDDSNLATCSLGAVLAQSREYTPFVANFDADPESEILWISGFSSTHVMWWDVEQVLENTCNAMTISSMSFPTPTFYKPFVGDFNGDGTNDLFWYRGGNGSNSPATLWFFRPDASRSYRTVTSAVIPSGDYSPYAGDFDGDGCEDVLWFAPHQVVSPLSRGRCAAVDEISEPFQPMRGQMHPSDAYPLGYSRTRGRR